MSEIAFNTYKSFNGTVSEQKFNSAIDLIQSIALNQGVGYSLSRNPTGSVLKIKPGAGTVVTCPFDATIAPATGTNINVTLRAGTVNNLLPDNMFTTFTVDSTSIIQVKATATTNGQAVTSVTLNVDTTAASVQTPTPFALPSTVDVLISVIVNGIAYRIIPCGTINLVGQQQFITDKSPPATPGTLNYIPYYTWELS